MLIHINESSPRDHLTRFDELMSCHNFCVEQQSYLPFAINVSSFMESSCNNSQNNRSNTVVCGETAVETHLLCIFYGVERVTQLPYVFYIFFQSIIVDIPTRTMV